MKKILFSLLILNLIACSGFQKTSEKMRTEMLKEKALRYYEKINLGEFDEEYFGLFAEDVEFFYPKYGYDKGREAIKNFGEVIQKLVKSLTFHLDKFVYTTSENRVVVEIVERGETQSGKKFPNEKTSFGRFCNVFEFNEKGEIKRYYCYGDPDFAGEDTVRVKLFSKE